MGVKAGGNHTRLDLNNLSLDNQVDPAFSPDNVGKFMPNYGFGLYYYAQSGMLDFHLPIWLITILMQHKDITF